MIKNRIIYNTFSDYKFKFTRAQGSFVWDDDGHKLIDFTSGWNVINLGWNHPEIAEPISIQVKKNVYAPMWTADPIQERYAEALTNSLPSPLRAVGRATGGTEANEEAIKTARAYTGKHKIIGFKDAYHGQSLSTLAIGYSPNYAVSKAVGPFVPGFVQMDFPGDLTLFSVQLEKALSNQDVAAVICEAGIITGWGGGGGGPPRLFFLIKKMAKKKRAPFIISTAG